MHFFSSTEQCPLSFYSTLAGLEGFHDDSGGKESACNAGNSEDVGSAPGSGRSPGEGNGNPLQYSCLGNPMDRGAWRAIVCGVVKGQTLLSDYHFHFHCWAVSLFLGLPPLPDCTALQGRDWGRALFSVPGPVLSTAWMVSCGHTVNCTEELINNPQSIRAADKEEHGLKVFGVKSTKLES